MGNGVGAVKGANEALHDKSMHGLGLSLGSHGVDDRSRLTNTQIQRSPLKEEKTKDSIRATADECVHAVDGEVEGETDEPENNDLFQKMKRPQSRVGEPSSGVKRKREQNEHEIVEWVDSSRV